ncbi:hypothetical protein L228DRAFT_87365 [Xylona heveae TC161]|uniref:Methyltransferase domain-containing protein n=1 Tax=Xylona heveae (strain CBS 132557 / TC161) TaxID=1328760 RepID=A0A165HX42_XYLHT|nr:hypothetical protein L228DRAFT_87365 [Xylona heveae TC161]KZF24050.1 hypothetical protein L228DRAFT_87365 [Xylona heveae TC161]
MSDPEWIAFPTEEEKAKFKALEVGCTDGVWCHDLARRHPKWIVEGIDTTVMWPTVADDEGAGKMKASTQNEPLAVPYLATYDWRELMGRELPIKAFDFIRARDIMTGVINYKELLKNLYQ